MAAPVEGLDRGSITLTGLSAIGRHGVLDSEHRLGQRFVVDLRLDLPIDTLGDDLSGTVDYSVLAVAVVGIIEGEPVRLIETLAGRIASRCLAEPLVQAVHVCVHKPEAPITVDFADVSVTLSRSKP